jgi:formamidopyrimidine-DNA glycosylase
MPELPEVETVARGLQASVAGRRILSVTLRKADFVDDPALLERELPGRQIARIGRYGKFMLLQLANASPSPQSVEPPQKLDTQSFQEALLVHLGMTGNLAPYAAAEPLEKHTHITFVLDDGRELRYTDARRFGRMAYLSGETLAAELKRFGADPLEVSREDFFALVHGSKARIKALLLDQTVLRGVGNIYADESLWRAKIHPATPGERLTPQQAETLRKALKDILLRAIAKKGSSISDFVDTNGRSGSYQNYHRVYGQEGKPCHRCSTPIRRIIVAGRSSHFCPACQPKPRGVRVAARQAASRPMTKKSPRKKKVAKRIGRARTSK